MATDLPSTEPNLGAPFIPIPGVPNLRDIGGYPTTTGSTIKKGLVYRAAAPHDIPEEGFQQLTELGWKTVFDLRSNTEIEKAAKAGSGGVVEIPGAERVFNPVFADEDYSPQTLAVRFANYASGTPEGFTKAYSHILADAAPCYARMFRHIAERPRDPLMLHCTAGKDRTGVFIALLLSLCGVDDDTVATEYNLTEQGLAHWKEKAVERLLKSPNLELHKEGALNMLGARKESMLATLKMIQDVYGGAEGYLLNQCGLSQEEVGKIKTALVVQEDVASEGRL